MVASSSSPIKRLYPATSVLKIAASLRSMPTVDVWSGNAAPPDHKFEPIQDHRGAKKKESRVFGKLRKNGSPSFSSALFPLPNFLRFARFRKRKKVTKSY